MTITDNELFALLESWLWPFLRIAGLFMAGPVFGMQGVPAKTRIILAMAVTWVVTPLLDLPVLDPFSPEGLLVTFHQVMIGIGLGVAVRLIFMVMELAGQVISQQIGLGFASMVDPQNGAQVPVVSHFYTVIAMLMFLSLNGHLVLIQVLVESFRTMPVATTGITREGLWGVVTWGGWLVAHAVLIALPAITSLMIINLAFGVMSRAAPQLNIISVGFPMMTLIGIGVLLVTISGLESHYTLLFEGALGLAKDLMERF